MFIVFMAILRENLQYITKKHFFLKMLHTYIWIRNTWTFFEESPGQTFFACGGEAAAYLGADTVALLLFSRYSLVLCSLLCGSSSNL